MARIAPLSTEKADASIARTLDQVKAKFGKVPNAISTFALSSSALNGYLGFATALGHGRLTARQREGIALAVSQVNGCQYCLSAHTFSGKAAGLTLEEIKQARVAESANPQDQAVVAFAAQVVKQRGNVSDADLTAARAAGLDDGLLVEIVANVALSTLTNYTNIVAGTDVDFPAVEVNL